MPKLAPDQVPSYRLHKQSGQAVVTLSGRDVLLGVYGSGESRGKYNRVTAEWLANGRQLRVEPAAVTISILLNAYWKHCDEYYPGDRGRGERQSIKLAMGFLRRLYGPTPAAQFGPLALKAVRQAMVDAGWCRTYVNAQAGRVRRIYAWGVENEMVPATVHHALQAVAGLRLGKCAAREIEPVRPVPEAFVDATLDHVSPQVKAMIELQLLTGMRPGEVCSMRTGEIDTTGKLWTYKPATHKTPHRGHERTIYLGPRAQAVLGPWLKPDLQAFIFSPAEAEQARREKLHAERLEHGTPFRAATGPAGTASGRPAASPATSTP
jgi:integrase